MKTEEYLQELSNSDLSVEEKLASGASISDLISAGVLHDDYLAGHDFTEEEEVAEEAKYAGPPVSDEEHERNMARLNWYNSGRYLTENASDKPV